MDEDTAKVRKLLLQQTAIAGFGSFALDQQNEDPVRGVGGSLQRRLAGLGVHDLRQERLRVDPDTRESGLRPVAGACHIAVHQDAISW